MDTRQIQTALQAKGFDPGPIDGVRGRKTIDAIIAFQTANGLQADGIVGPMTEAKLFAGAPAPQPSPSVAPTTQPWMIEALRLIGIKEDTSAASNPVIIGWAKTRYGMATQTLANGYCGLPVQKSCPHANACLTCPMFVTTPEFLPQHHAQRQATLALITAAEAAGHTRVAEMNKQVAANLDKIITVLEDDAGSHQAAADAS
jgi:ferredoxin